MEAFVEEVINETMGTSHRKWALLLVAMLVGAVGALWLTRRSGATESATAPADDRAGSVVRGAPSGDACAAASRWPGRISHANWMMR